MKHFSPARFLILITLLFFFVLSSCTHAEAVTASAHHCTKDLLVKQSTTADIVYWRKYGWLQKHQIVAHAFGGIDNYTCTNSLEAFEANYAKGYRLFEVDFILTSDNYIVAAHDWTQFYSMSGRDNSSEIVPLSLEEFKSSVIYEQYTPLAFSDVILLLQQYPDIYIITDTKYTQDPMITTTFTQIIQEANSVDPRILNRIIPQIYNNEMYYIIYDLYPWNCVIYTLYNQTEEEFSYDNIFNFAMAHDIKVFTTFPGRSDQDFLDNIFDAGGYLFIHTLNDIDSAQKYAFDRGATGVYSDFLFPDSINRLIDK